MRKLLVVDCCIRKEESRTKKILERFLSAAPSDCEVERLVLTEENLAPLMGDFFEQRQRLLETGDFGTQSSLQMPTLSSSPPPSGTWLSPRF